MATAKKLPRKKGWPKRAYHRRTSESKYVTESLREYADMLRREVKAIDETIARIESVSGILGPDKNIDVEILLKYVAECRVTGNQVDRSIVMALAADGVSAADVLRGFIADTIEGMEAVCESDEEVS